MELLSDPSISSDLNFEHKRYSIPIPMQEKAHIGIVGTGFIAQGLSFLLHDHPNFALENVLTRREPSSVTNLAISPEKITNSTQQLIDSCDIVVECSGDPFHATSIVFDLLKAGVKVITMDSELQITAGSWLKKFGYLTEAEGDQPGSIAALNLEAREMGFKPRVYGNIKGFLNQEPTPEDMDFWSHKSGISLQQVTSFTDGTKVNIEQVLVANGLCGDILMGGLLGLKSDDLKTGALQLSEIAAESGVILSDYILCPTAPAGVFIMGEHDSRQVDHLRYYKMGDGPFYLLLRPFHLCHLEVIKTIKRVMSGQEPLLDNGDNPKYSVAAVSKHILQPGDFIERGIGGFDVRGVAVDIDSYKNHLPIGLMAGVRLTRKVLPGEILELSDVEIPDSLALSAWQSSIKT